MAPSVHTQASDGGASISATSAWWCAPLQACRVYAAACRGFNLKAKFVIHTVGPIYESAEESAPLLANCYKCAGLGVVRRPGVRVG